MSSHTHALAGLNTQGASTDQEEIRPFEHVTPLPEIPQFSIHQGIRSDMSVTDFPSSSTKIKLKDIPVEIRDRRAVFGYIIDNELLVNWYSKKCGIQDFSEPEHYFDALSKRDLALIAADAAKCSILTVSRTLPSEEIIFAYFASYKPPCISTATLPTEGQLQKFKDCLSLDDDPQWRLLVASV